MARYKSLADIQIQLKAGTLTCVQVVNYYLNQIQNNTSLNAYVEVFEAEALQKAHTLDEKLENNPESLGRLFGMVASIKDVLCYKDHQVTAGSKILEGFTSLFSATAVDRLVQEDAIIIGRVNCDEFAMGSSNETSVYGATKNAIDETKVPGGSSGGSAVSVQADTCLLSLGTDTGGSVRQPAAFCGLVGFKPTYGRISRHGLLAYASSFDQIGIFANTIEDVAITLEVIAGHDEYDATVSKKTVPSYSTAKNLPQKTRIAYINSAIHHPSLDDDIQAQTLNFINRLQQDGHTVEAVDFDLIDYLVPTYYVLTTAEASSNLARYDGIRYGYRSQSAGNLLETYTKTRTEGFGIEVKRRIMLGTFVLSAGYYDAYYSKAQQVRRLVKDRFKAIFENYDFIIMPTTPTPAYNLGEHLDDPVAVYLADIYTVSANLAGMPAISLPFGTHSSGLPIGLQLMADSFKEEELLQFSASLGF